MMKSVCVLFLSLLCVQCNVANGQSLRRWVVSTSVKNVVWNSNNYSNASSRKLFDFGKGGQSLKTALAPIGATAILIPGVGFNRTQVPDYDNNECAGFIRKTTGAPGTYTWRRGRPVIYPNGFSAGVTPGTAIATFVPDASKPGGYRYEGHTGLYMGTTTSGGILMVDQNWYKDKTMAMHTLSSTFSGTVSDALAYYVIETQ